MRIVSLASGSRGNATIVEHEGSAILVDCGTPYCALKSCEFEAVLVTHSHTDHISGLKTLLRHRDVPVYANLMTAETVANDRNAAHECKTVLTALPAAQSSVTGP